MATLHCGDFVPRARCERLLGCQDCRLIIGIYYLALTLKITAITNHMQNEFVATV